MAVNDHLASIPDRLLPVLEAWLEGRRARALQELEKATGADAFKLEPVLRASGRLKELDALLLQLRTEMKERHG